ncbi:LPXTG cell wall anchor domain-containing protein [Kitasatospora gansuensis]
MTASVIPSAVPTPVPSAAPVGELAATGSSASPVFAVAGAAALALGAGAVLVARRRKDDADR